MHALGLAVVPVVDSRACVRWELFDGRGGDGRRWSFCIREHLEPDALERVFSLDGGARGMLTELERGTATQTDFVAHLAPILGVSPTRLLERILADLAIEPIVANTIKMLRHNGIQTAVLSNSWGAGPYDPYEIYDLAANFDAVVLSHEVGHRKPEPAILQIAADRLRVRPDECAFVDDVSAYLVPAKTLGMTTIHAVDPVETARELARTFDSRLANGVVVQPFS